MATTAPVTTKPTAIKSQSVSVAAAVAATSRAAELETACGWKGSFNHGQHQQQEPTKHSASSSSMSLDSVPLPPPSMERGDDESSFDPERYSSGEVSTVSESVERDGIRALHAALTRTERTQMDAFDPTMLVRHFRAEKVRGVLLLVYELSTLDRVRLSRLVSRHHFLDTNPNSQRSFSNTKWYLIILSVSRHHTN